MEFKAVNEGWGMRVEKINKWKIFVRQYLLYFIPVTLFLIIVSLYLYHAERNKEIALLLEEEATALKLKENFIEHEMEVVEADIQVLTGVDELTEYFDLPNRKNLNKLKLAYLFFSEQKDIYDQIRILDLEGFEILRIENKGSTADIIDDVQLQDKSGRYYFNESMKLGKGEIYISKLDLNIEEGMIEVPFVPTIRFGMPFFMKNTRKCIVVINFNAVRFLESIGESYLDVAGVQMLLNEDGYWLLSNKKEEEWGFMFEDKKDSTFQNKYPYVWSVITKNENGVVENDDGVFIYRTIYYSRYRGVNIARTSQLQPDLNWKLISFLSHSAIDGFAYPILVRRIITGVLLLLGAMFAIAFIAYLRVKDKMAQKAISDQVDYLTERDKMKNRFMAIFSHDLKNSVGALHNYSVLLKEDYHELDEDDRLRYVSGIEDISNNTKNLLLTLLEWARSFLTVNKYICHLINLGEIVNNNIDLLKHEADLKNITLVSNISYGTEIYADENVLNVLLRNFIFNAIKFTDRGGEIKIYIRNADEDKIYIVVEDNGVGMTEEQAKKILDPAQKYTTRGTNKEGGSGMGLKLCKELIEKHEGELLIESEPGKGSKFCFYLAS